MVKIHRGRTASAAKAAASHTWSLSGSDEVLDAAFRRCGVLRVDTISEVFYMAEVLAKQPRPKGPRLAIVTNAGGPGVLAVEVRGVGGAEVFMRLTQASTNYVALGRPAFGALTRLIGAVPALAIDYPDTATAISLVDDFRRELAA